MKKNNIQDERIISQRRKIQSDAYQILVYCLLISIVIQQFILNAPFAQFAVELYCLIGIHKEGKILSQYVVDNYWIEFELLII